MLAPPVEHGLLLARRMARLGTETAFEVLNKARALERQGKSIIHLEIGEPDFDTPPNVVEAAVDALHSGWTHYGPSAGLPELREAIAEYVSRTRGVSVSTDEVVVVPGGKPIIFFTMLALIEEGDEVIYPNPGFPIYESMINYVGGRAVPIQLREERDFAMDVDELQSRITDRTKLMTGILWFSLTRSTAACSSRASRSRSCLSPECRSAPYCSTAFPRPTR
jgi:aspartate/methionine/tyrosine aminotransferase